MITICYRKKRWRGEGTVLIQVKTEHRMKLLVTSGLQYLDIPGMLQLLSYPVMYIGFHFDPQAIKRDLWHFQKSCSLEFSL